MIYTNQQTTTSRHNVLSQDNNREVKNNLNINFIDIFFFLECAAATSATINTPPTASTDTATAPTDTSTDTPTIRTTRSHHVSRDRRSGNRPNDRPIIKVRI